MGGIGDEKTVQGVTVCQGCMTERIELECCARQVVAGLCHVPHTYTIAFLIIWGLCGTSIAVTFFSTSRKFFHFSVVHSVK